MNVQLSWIVLSGIPANHTGTGRLMQHLEKAVLARRRFDGTIIYNPERAPMDQARQDMLAAVPRLIVFHPQLLGMPQTYGILRKRAAAGKQTHYYILDNSFFCVRSYNHLDQDVSPCFKCVGEGGHVNAATTGCRPWPSAEPFASDYVKGLHELAASGAVSFFSQNREHMALARRHFGDGVSITLAGLWCADWTDLFDAFEKNGITEKSGGYDVVYHGSRDMAKGIGWLLAVAARTPDVTYLVPLDRGPANIQASPNVKIVSMRWDEGLHDEILKAGIVICPSLWSSPIEGALVKSIVTAKAAAVVDNPAGFASEVPGDVVLRLPAALDAAAKTLRDAVRTGWRPDGAARTHWVRNFRAFNEKMAERLLPENA